jgi:hypothetical protein
MLSIVQGHACTVLGCVQSINGYYLYLGGIKNKGTTNVTHAWQAYHCTPAHVR